MAELWVIGADKKQQFQVCEESTLEALPLALFSGYGVIIYGPDGGEIGRFGVGLDDFDATCVSVVDETTFEVAFDKSLNITPGFYKYRVHAVWPDSDFEDGDFDEFSGKKKLLFRSIE